MYIEVTREYDGCYYAVDMDTYDVDCDENGFYSLTPIGYGRSALDATVDLLLQMREDL